MISLGSTGALGKLGSVLAVAAVSVGATIVISGPTTKAIAFGPRAWFDAPLDGTYLAEGPVRIVAHAADPDGIVEVQLSVGGKVTQTIDAGGEQLVEVTMDWAPPGKGTFDLTVLGLDNHQHKTLPDTVTVHIGEDPTQQDLEDASSPTTTSVPGDTTTSTEANLQTTLTSAAATTTTTSERVTTTTPGSTTTVPATTPTTTPTTTSTTVVCPGQPAHVSPANGANVNSNPTLTWSYSGCAVREFVVQVAPDPRFGRLVRETRVAWPSRSTAAPVTCSADAGTWYWRVRTAALDGPWSSPTSFTLVCRAP